MSGCGFSNPQSWSMAETSIYGRAYGFYPGCKVSKTRIFNSGGGGLPASPGGCLTYCKLEHVANVLMPARNYNGPAYCCSGHH